MSFLDLVISKGHGYLGGTGLGLRANTMKKYVFLIVVLPDAFVQETGSRLMVCTLQARTV